MKEKKIYTNAKYLGTYIIKEEIKKYLETNDNENMKTQNLWDAARAVLREKLSEENYLVKKKKKKKRKEKEKVQDTKF